LCLLGTRGRGEKVIREKWEREKTTFVETKIDENEV